MSASSLELEKHLQEAEEYPPLSNCSIAKYEEPTLEREAAILDATRLLHHLRGSIASMSPPDLAKYLCNLATKLSDLHWHDLSIKICQWGARLAPLAELEKPELARSLIGLSSCYQRIGKPLEGVQAARLALDVYRRLSEEQPAEFTPFVGAALNSLSFRLAADGDINDAIHTFQESVKVFRDLSRQPELAIVLDNLSYLLSQSGNQEEALTAAEEASKIYQQLANESHGATFVPSLAKSLNNLAIRRYWANRHDDAFQAITDAVARYRQLADARPEGFLPELAISLSNAAAHFHQHERYGEEIKANEEAVNIRRQLFKEQPVRFRPLLARSLRSLSFSLADSDRKDEERQYLREAMELEDDATYG